ncbi:MAG: hypothetical protein OEN23_11450 [Paracoccaceae bacterium]|nr:hypothetical protein [Paracoccaceae bacterium]
MTVSSGDTSPAQALGRKKAASDKIATCGTRSAPERLGAASLNAPRQTSVVNAAAVSARATVWAGQRTWSASQPPI